MSKKQTERNKNIFRDWANRANSIASIAKKYGVSRRRVHAVVSAEIKRRAIVK